MLRLFAFVIVFNTALATALLVVPLARALSFRHGVTSVPGGRRQERAAMPKLGGMAIFLGFTVAIIVAQFLPIERQDPYEVFRLAGLTLGGTVIFLLGVLDDFRGLNWFQIFLGQIFTSAIAIIFQIFIAFFNNPFTGTQTGEWSPVVTVTLTLFWLVLMMNTVNLVDGSDGLAGGIALIAAFVLFLNSAVRLEPPQTSVSLLPLALAGALLGFLIYNYYPARIYMGGSAWFLGYALGTLSIIGGAKMATILLVMGLPLMDLGWQIVNRIRHGNNPFRGDRGHLHFRLLDTGIFSPRQIALCYYSICAFFGFLTLVTTSQMFKFIAFAFMLVCIATGFVAVGRISALQDDEGSSS
ncbi:MAG: MraY family glycosyltransferase [Chloroflexota bacterium]|nr:MraY family glycosyltransferase [Chloroflexota bacterium]MDE2946343.1 MraY family glycosyltransferase [Chloroflexota bacterium]